MKLLLDENLPLKLKYRLLERGLEVITIADKKWNSKQNGELLELLNDEGFTHFLTFDSHLSFQQNLLKYPIPVIAIIAPFNNYAIIMGMFEEIVRVVKTAVAGSNIVIYQKK